MDRQENEEQAAEKTFAELMAESDTGNNWLQPGQKVEALIVKITPEWAFIDLGGKSEGYLDIKEFDDGQGNVTVQEGQRIRAYFLSSRNNEKLFTTRLGRGSAGKAYLEDAFLNGIPLEGTVTKEVKGGFEIAIAGEVRAFCPFSQFLASRGENSAEYQGKRLPFKVIEYGENGRNIILSHRAILEEEKSKQREALRASLKEGDIVRGTVVSLRDFGAFVDIGGIQGLLPLSEMSWDRTEESKDLITPGAELPVAIIRLNWDKEQITLSRKATLPDPWLSAAENFPKGSQHSGCVTSLTAFGAFVTLGTGVDGLLHISKLAKGKKIKHAGEVLTKGQRVEVMIEAVDEGKKRISLNLVGSEEEASEPAESYHKYLEVNNTAFGSLGDVFKIKNIPKSASKQGQ